MMTTIAPFLVRFPSCRSHNAGTELRHGTPKRAEHTLLALGPDGPICSASAPSLHRPRGLSAVCQDPPANPRSLPAPTCQIYRPRLHTKASARRSLVSAPPRDGGAPIEGTRGRAELHAGAMVHGLLLPTATDGDGMMIMNEESRRDWIFHSELSSDEARNGFEAPSSAVSLVFLYSRDGVLSLRC